MSNEVKIPVSLPGAAQASSDAAKVADGVNKINKATVDQGKAAKEAGKGTAEMGKELLTLGEVTEKGIGIGRMFGEVMRGNFLALGNVTAALKVTGAAMKTNVIGMLLLGATAIANALPAIIEKIRGMGAASKESGEEATHSFGAAKTGLEQLNQAKLTALKDEIDSVADRAKALEAMVARIEASQKRLRTSRLNLTLAEIDADPTLSPEEKKRRQFDAREQAQQEEDQATDSTANRRVLDAEGKVTDASGAVASAEAAAGRQREIVETNRRAPGDLARVLQELTSQLKDIAAQRVNLRSGDDAASTSKDVELSQQQKAIEEQRAYIEARIATRESKASKDAGTEQAKTLGGFEQTLRSAQQSLATARAELAAAEAAAPGANPSEAIARGMDRRTRRLQNGIPEPESNIDPNPQPSSVTGGEFFLKGSNGDDIGSRIGAAVAKRIAEGEAAIAGAVERRLARDADNMRRLEDQIKGLR